MAKTYIDIVKYMIEGSFNIDGLVDKPDIIGAVFGQTEGLLGDELDLRELQKNGKIGRIEIDISQSGSKTYGKLHLPASLDRVETCILAAAVESVDRVGPYDADFRVDKVEDTRSEKRRKVLERAKELVKKLLSSEIPDSKELAELVQADVKVSEIIAYGAEHLPAGPDVGRSGEVILVEGRADVLNLLRSDITNAVAIGGATTIPKGVITLCDQKEVTVFLDGDRGGDMILRALLAVAEVDYVAKAPEGKEVEELTRKEIIKAIRSRIPIEQYLGMNKMAKPQNFVQRQQVHEQRTAPKENDQQREPMIREQINQSMKELTEVDDGNQDLLPKIEAEPPLPIQQAPIPAPKPKVEQYAPVTKPAMESAALAQLVTGLDELAGTLRSRIYNVEGGMMRELPIRELITFLQNDRSNGIFGIVLDGVITQRLIELALQKNIRAIYGLKANPMPRKHPELIIYTKEQGKME